MCWQTELITLMTPQVSAPSPYTWPREIATRPDTPGLALMRQATPSSSPGTTSSCWRSLLCPASRRRPSLLSTAGPHLGNICRFSPISSVCWCSLARSWWYSPPFISIHLLRKLLGSAVVFRAGTFSINSYIQRYFPRPILEINFRCLRHTIM